MTELPSRTSVWAAAARAVGSRIQHPHWHNPDELADKILGPDERALLAGHPLAEAMEQDTPQLRDNPELMSSVMTLIVRTKFIDEKLRAAVADGAQQIVIMGAGWDTRAYRFKELLQGIRIFEVDRSNTQDRKRQRAEEALGPAPANLTYLAIDFRVQKLSDVLAAGGYDPSKKTFFIWEGVTMYLPEAAVRETLTWIAQQACGSSLVFDFTFQALIDYMAQLTPDTPLTPEAKIGVERLRTIEKWGEPWIFGVPQDVEGFFTSLGLAHRETMGMSSTEAAQRYLGWDQDSPFPSAVRKMYSISEVGVK
ncbi:MAG: SAM-dependent methyltransferase [Acidobacteriota bacterium]